MNKDTENISILEDIRAQITEINTQRVEVKDNNEEREILELSLIALKEAERVEVARLSGELIEQMSEVSDQLKAYAKQIRERVTKMSQFHKDVNSVEQVAKGIVRVVTAVTKWL